MNSRSLTRILHELNPVASIVIASRPKAAWRSRLLDCFVVSPRNDGHACTLCLPLSPQGTVCPLKYPALTGFPALFHALTRILHELSPVASIVIASRPKAAWRSRLLDCFVVSPRNDGHAYTLCLPLSPQGTVCPLKYPG